MVWLRPASKNDTPAVRALVRKAHINPMDLDWQRFVVAVAPMEEIIGCGQIKVHRDGSHELASIAVEPAWRKHGVARMIIEHLLDNHRGEIYLTCRSSLRTFYEKFGFLPVQIDEMPAYFRHISHLVRLLGKVSRRADGLLVMRRG